MKRIRILFGLIAIAVLIQDGWAQEDGELKRGGEGRLLSQIPAICPLRFSEYPYITSLFGLRYHPVDGKYKMHYGIDLACLRGFQFVYATARGIVTYAGLRPRLGKSISILHPGEFESGYGHLSELYVEKGNWVEAGDIIGVMGQTGLATGIHLHYSLLKRGKWVDPLPYLTLYESVGNKKDATKASESR